MAAPPPPPHPNNYKPQYYCGPESKVISRMTGKCDEEKGIKSVF